MTAAPDLPLPSAHGPAHTLAAVALGAALGMAAALLLAPVLREVLELGAYASELVALAGGAGGAFVAALDARTLRTEARAMGGSRGLFAGARASAAFTSSLVLGVVAGLAAAFLFLHASWAHFGSHMSDGNGAASLFNLVWYGFLFLVFAVLSLGAAASVGLGAMFALVGIASAHALMTTLERSGMGRWGASLVCLSVGLGGLFFVEVFLTGLFVATAPFAALVPVALAGAALWKAPTRSLGYAGLGVAALAGLVALAVSSLGMTAERERIASQSYPDCYAAPPVAGVKCMSSDGLGRLTAIPDGSRADTDVARDLAALTGSCRFEDGFAPAHQLWSRANAATPLDLVVHATVQREADSSATDAELVARAKEAVKSEYRHRSGAICASSRTPLDLGESIYVECGGESRCHVEVKREGACAAGAVRSGPPGAAPSATPGCIDSLKGPPTRYVREVTTDVVIAGAGVTAPAAP